MKTRKNFLKDSAFATEIPEPQWSGSIPSLALSGTLLSDGFGLVGGLIDRGAMARRVKQPNTDGYYQRHHDDHSEDQSSDI